tara:strand:+ start:651 stop:1466 length:816 start_codon:yes stop_codon:yes gene_type:complete
MDPKDLNLHPEINKKLSNLLKAEKIPNIIFHGPSGSGKRVLVNDFVKQIYSDKIDELYDSVMDVNCAHGKGIKFIREELKFFAKTNMKGDSTFKTIILTNADKLTSDAQSALRRCIELYSHNTRFFIIVENKYRLLRPILSRFCEIYIPEPIVNGKKINLHQHNLLKCFSNEINKDKQRNSKLDKLINASCVQTFKQVVELVNNLYEKGYSALDLISYIETLDFPEKKKYQWLLIFRKIKREFRNEKLMMTFIIAFVFIRSEHDLENITFM